MDECPYSQDTNYPTLKSILLGITALAILILSAIAFVKGRALSAILYPTPISTLFGIAASAILILQRLVFVKGCALSA